MAHLSDNAGNGGQAPPRDVTNGPERSEKDFFQGNLHEFMDLAPPNDRSASVACRGTVPVMGCVGCRISRWGLERLEVPGGGSLPEGLVGGNKGS